MIIDTSFQLKRMPFALCINIAGSGYWDIPKDKTEIAASIFHELKTQPVTAIIEGISQYQIGCYRHPNPASPNHLIATCFFSKNAHDEFNRSGISLQWIFEHHLSRSPQEISAIFLDWENRIGKYANGLEEIMRNAATGKNISYWHESLLDEMLFPTKLGEEKPYPDFTASPQIQALIQRLTNEKKSSLPFGIFTLRP